jgi:putative endonuclease
MTEARLALGRWGEAAAAAFLEARGMRILERNLRTPVGEIDILARAGQVLVFAEVKTRRNDCFGAPQEAVGRNKQRQVVRAAQWYLGSGAGRGLQPRFDVLAVRPGPDGQALVEHFPNAFGV